jgi:hypothetical protein
MVLNLPLDECIDNTTRNEIQRKKVRRKKNKEAQLMTKERSHFSEFFIKLIFLPLVDNV